MFLCLEDRMYLWTMLLVTKDEVFPIGSFPYIANGRLKYGFQWTPMEHHMRFWNFSSATLYNMQQSTCVPEMYLISTSDNQKSQKHEIVEYSIGMKKPNGALPAVGNSRRWSQNLRNIQRYFQKNRRAFL